MRPLFCVDDSEGVGKSVVAIARARGLEARVFSKVLEVPRSEAIFVFAWLPNDAYDASVVRVLLKYLRGRQDTTLVPDYEQATMHGDRIGQALRLGALMPKTLVLTNAERALLAIDELRTPFISKSQSGNGGSNSRVVLTPHNARLEISMAFGKDAPGIPANPKQRDYLLWQEFLPGNPFTYRVMRVGEYEMVVRRYRDSHDPLKIVHSEAVTEFDDDAGSAMSAARGIFDKIGSKFGVVDVALDRNKAWRMLGTAARWPLDDVVEAARFFGKGTGYYGRTWIQLLLDELEEGVFA